MKILLASDLHYVTNLDDEISSNQARLPANTYNHRVDGKLYWHNQMQVEEGEALLDGLLRLAHQEEPQLLIFIGDMVNINWQKSIAGASKRFNRFPCPVRLVTGNHDIYLAGVENRLQEAIVPGSYETGLRHETIGLGDESLGMITLDLFARNSDGDYQKWRDPLLNELVGYRPEDVDAALALMAGEPEKPWLILGHFPCLAPDPRVELPGRKLGREWPSGDALAAHLIEANNLMGIICGHQHFAHFQAFDHGFHWTLPALVEFPCAAAVLEWDGATLQGRLVTVNEELAATSLHPRQERWTEGEESDRQFVHKFIDRAGA